MQPLNCEKHQLKKDFAFCLESSCKDRLVCKKCFALDQKHNGHRFVMIEFLMENDENEIKRIFDDEYLKNMKEGMDVKQFLKQFDNEFNKYLDEKEEELRTPFEQMITNYRASLEKAKYDIYDEFNVEDIKSIQQIKQNITDLIENDDSQDKQNAVKYQIDCCNQIDMIKKKLHQMIEQLEQVNQQTMHDFKKLFKTLESRQNSIFGQSNDSNLEYVRKLKQCGNQVWIEKSDKIDEYRNQVKQMQEQKKDYRIYVNFYHSDTNIQFKQEVLEMVDQLGANDRVGQVGINLNSNNQFDIDLIKKIVSRYDNLWAIYICDQHNQVDNDIHNQLKMMVKKSTLLGFELYFNKSSLNTSDQALKLLKDYNRIIQTKVHLIGLRYTHQKINKISNGKETIRQTIEETLNL